MRPRLPRSSGSHSASRPPRPMRSLGRDFWGVLLPFGAAASDEIVGQVFLERIAAMRIGREVAGAHAREPAEHVAGDVVARIGPLHARTKHEPGKMLLLLAEPVVHLRLNRTDDDVR